MVCHQKLNIAWAGSTVDRPWKKGEIAYGYVRLV
jgi:hypothetical protein